MVDEACLQSLNAFNHAVGDQVCQALERDTDIVEDLGTVTGAAVKS